MQLTFPIEPYVVSDKAWRFGDRVPRRLGLWAQHLGDDIVAAAGTAVTAIGAGEVVLAEMLLGSETHRSWGGVIVLRHNNDQAPMTNDQSNLNDHMTEEFYSVYGHLRDLQVKVGDAVAAGQRLGEVAVGLTPENGWWKVPHLHFAIYTGPWEGKILPGYWRPERFWRTRLSWWHNPKPFIEKYGAS